VERRASAKAAGAIDQVEPIEAIEAISDDDVEEIEEVEAVEEVEAIEAVDDILESTLRIRFVAIPREAMRDDGAAVFSAVTRRSPVLPLAIVRIWHGDVRSRHVTVAIWALVALLLAVIGLAMFAGASCTAGVTG